MNTGAEKLDPAKVSTSLIVRTQSTPDSTAELTEPLRVRVPGAMEGDLNSVEAYFRGQGHRHVTRSHLVRVALDSFIEDVKQKHPEIFG